MTRQPPVPQLNWHLPRIAAVFMAVCFLTLASSSAAGQTHFSFETDGYMDVTPIVFAPNNLLLALTANGADILLFDLVKEREVALLKHATGVKSPVSVGRMEFSPDSHTLAVSFVGDVNDREIVFFDVEKRSRRGAVPLGPVGCALNGTFSTDGRRFAATISTTTHKRSIREVRVWESESLRQIKSLDDSHIGGKIAFSHDGRWLATAHGLTDTRGQVILWDAATLERRFTLRAGGGWLELAFSPDSRLIAAGLNHHQKIAKAVAGVRLWDVQTGEERGWMDGYKAGPESAGLVFPVFAPGSMLLAATCYSDLEQVKLWDLSTGETRVLDHDRGGKWGYCRAEAQFSPDGSLLATAANFGRFGQFGVRLWETRAWTEAALLDISSGIPSIAPLPAMPPLQWAAGFIRFSPDGKWLTARRTRLGGPNKQDVFLWKVSEVVRPAPKTTEN